MVLLQVVWLHAALLLAVAAGTMELLRVAVHSVRVVAPAASLSNWAIMDTLRTVHTATASCMRAIGKGKRRFGWQGSIGGVARLLCACAAAVHCVVALVLPDVLVPMLPKLCDLIRKHTGLPAAALGDPEKADYLKNVRRLSEERRKRRET